jgi:molybdopterin synthase catalytic subunit
MRRIVVTPSAFDPAAELAAFANNLGGAGALASFVGYCREEDQGAPIERLELQHYSGFTEKEIERIAERVAARLHPMALLVIHRTGAIAPKEAIVLVAALARHRDAAFAAVEEIMDYLKTDAPFWKREVSQRGDRWIEPTQDDRRRRARWSDE